MLGSCRNTMRIATEEDLSEFKREAFRNSVRLFRDACLLFEKSRYPTAYSIGILSYEELGKTHAIDRACDLMCLNPESREQIYKDYVEGTLLYDHRYKQRRANADTVMFFEREVSAKSHFIQNGGLEVEKHKGFYVEFVNRKLDLPSRITKEKAFDLLKYVLNATEKSGDIGFNGFACISTAQSESQAKELLEQAKEAFLHCNIP